METETQASDWNPWQELENKDRGPSPVHYLWIAACVGICLLDKFIALFVRTGVGGYSTGRSGVFVISEIISAVGSGAALFGLGLFAMRRLKGKKFPQFEGEFLLLSTAVIALFFYMFHRLPTMFLGPVASLWAKDGFNFARIAPLVAGNLVLLLCWKRATVAWRLFIVVNVLAAFGQQLMFRRYGMGDELRILYASLSQLPLFFLIVVVLFDQSRKRELPWTHWLGIGACFVSQTSSFVLQFFFVIWPYIQMQMLL